MKNLFYIIIASISCSYLSPFSFAQSVSAEEMLSRKIGTDGLLLGMKKLDAIFEIGKKGNYTLAERFEHPQEGELLYYQSRKTNDAYVLSINDQDLIWGFEKQIFVNENSVGLMFKSQQADLLYRYGTPIINEMSHIVWRGEFYKIELIVQPAQDEYVIREIYVFSL